MKNQMMWNVGGTNQNEEEQDIISKGLALALLSNVLGLRSIENQFQGYLDRLRKSTVVADLKKRLNIQHNISNEILKIVLESNA
jgi:hypothetical protein